MDPLYRLLIEIAADRDTDRGLTRVCQAALEIIPAPNAVVATMSRELGILEVTHGAGPQFDLSLRGHQVQVDIGSGFGIIAAVAATGEAILTGDVHAHPHYKLRYESTKSEIAVPARDSNGRLRAVLNVESDQPNAFTEKHQHLCDALAAMVGVILEHRDDERRTEALMQVGRLMQTATEEEDLIQRVMRVGEEILGYQACSLFLYDERSATYVLRGSVSSLKDRIGSISYKPGEGCTGWVCETGRSILLDDPQSDPRWRGRFVEFPSDEIASFLAVPIMSRARCIGCFRLLRRKPGNRYLDVRYSPSDERVLEAIAEQFAVGLENIRNLERVVRDERMVAWGELSAKSSHMIGNRVFALRGDVNELGYQLGLPQIDQEELNELHRSLVNNITRVEELLQEFRDFLTATKLSLDTANLNETVEEIVRESFPKNAGVKLRLELADDLPQARIDVRKMHRALGELIENAVLHDDRGEITVRTFLPQDIRGQWIGLEVSDTGPGVEPSKKQLIFQPFYSGRVKGMGLGLSIVKGIVDAHGGQIREEGTVGDGAKFVILLPAVNRP